MPAIQKYMANTIEQDPKVLSCSVEAQIQGLLVDSLCRAWSNENDAISLRSSPKFSIRDTVNTEPLCSTLKRLALDDSGLGFFVNARNPVIAGGTSLFPPYNQTQPILTQVKNQDVYDFVNTLVSLTSSSAPRNFGHHPIHQSI